MKASAALLALVIAIWILPGIPPKEQPHPTRCKFGPCPEKKHYGDYMGGSKPNWVHGIGLAS